jgi:hypothetical protein
MADAELGKTYVSIVADLSQLRAGFAQAKAEATGTAQQISSQFSNINKTVSVGGGVGAAADPMGFKLATTNLRGLTHEMRGFSEIIRGMSTGNPVDLLRGLTGLSRGMGGLGIGSIGMLGGIAGLGAIFGGMSFAAHEIDKYNSIQGQRENKTVLESNKIREEDFNLDVLLNKSQDMSLYKGTVLQRTISANEDRLKAINLAQAPLSALLEANKPETSRTMFGASNNYTDAQIDTIQRRLKQAGIGEEEFYKAMYRTTNLKTGGGAGSPRSDYASGDVLDTEENVTKKMKEKGLAKTILYTPAAAQEAIKNIAGTSFDYNEVARQSIVDLLTKQHRLQSMHDIMGELKMPRIEENRMKSEIWQEQFMSTISSPEFRKQFKLNSITNSYGTTESEDYKKLKTLGERYKSDMEKEGTSQTGKITTAMGYWAMQQGTINDPMNDLKKTGKDIYTLLEKRLKETPVHVSTAPVMAH